MLPVKIPDQSESIDRIAGVVLGTAVGDALGLPREGLSARRAGRLFGGRPLGHRFLFGRGMISDDTEHTCMLAQALLEAGDDPDLFAGAFARRLRWWLLGVPAGIGFATLRSICRLWLGFGPDRSGVYSAGNGAAMRAGLLGLAFDDADVIAAYVRAATRVTHTDERAYEGALAVALACRYAGDRDARAMDAGEFFAGLRPRIMNAELREAFAAVEAGIAEGIDADAMAERLGLRQGVSGYVVHTVPMAVFCWLRYAGDFREAVERVICLGGDTDTTGAIVGAMCGASVSASGIPAEWVDGIWEWPRSVEWMRRLPERVAERGEPLRLFWLGIVIRNMLFTSVVICHALRRLLPPY